MLHHLVTVGAGAAWFVQPSASLEEMLQPTWGLLWSSLLIIYGTIGFLARLTERFFMESVAVAVMAVTLGAFGFIILVADDSRGLQAGLALVAGAFFRLGWALIQYAWISQPPLVQRIITAVNEHILDEARKEE